MPEYKKIQLLLVLSCFLTILKAQNIQWIRGAWKGIGNSSSKIHFNDQIIIDSVYGNNFSGSRTKVANDHNQTSIVTALSGHFTGNQIYIENGKILSIKNPPHGIWLDCGNCSLESKLTITNDTVILITRFSGCNKNCEGISAYYKLLCDFDTSTQRYLVNAFISPSGIQSFRPCIKDSVKIFARKKQHIQDSISNAAAIAEEKQRIRDSINNATAIAKEKQRIKDSINNAAAVAIEKQHIRDSINNATAIAKQKQHIKDSINNAAAIARDKQHIKDSISNAAAITKQKQHIKDSINNAVAIVREKQHIRDSINYAAAISKQKQHIKDSINNAATIAREKQHIRDSINNAAAIAREKQHIRDSINNAAAIAREKQHIKDSISNAAVIAKQKQHIKDSINNAAAIAIKKQEKKDSAKLASEASKLPDDKSKALVQRNNVLLKTYHITTPDILIELFDNGEIDGDRVSVYHNNSLIVNNKMLLTTPITFSIHADSSNRMHEFTLVAENLGTIPPNTALMRITAGKQVYELTVETDLKTNAKILFYYDGK